VIKGKIEVNTKQYISPDPLKRFPLYIPIKKKSKKRLPIKTMRNDGHVSSTDDEK
jgi:hypothetical protein